MAKRGGRKTNATRMLAEQWKLLLALQGSRTGMRVAQLAERAEIPRSTLYRYLTQLEDAGVPLYKTKINGEVRYRFLRSSELPPMGFTALQISALRLARHELQPLAGAALVGELDALLDKLRPLEAQQSLRFADKPAGRPEILRTVEQALHYGRRARIEYRAASRNGDATSVHIEPLLINVADGEPYVRAFCVERGSERTYKVARINDAKLTEEPATYRPMRKPAEAFAHSVKAWSGEPITVRIKLDPNVAWRAAEYPLVSNQSITKLADGAVVVEAHVSGLTEATRWVLSWGSAAEALEPAELRAATTTELAQALRKYDGPGPVKAASGKIDGRRRVASHGS